MRAGDRVFLNSRTDFDRERFSTAVVTIARSFDVPHGSWSDRITVERAHSGPAVQKRHARTIEGLTDA